jgi:hypothetical protein
MDYPNHFTHYDYLKLKPRYSDKPIDSFVCVIMIVLCNVGITVIISKLFFDIEELFKPFWELFLSCNNLDF